MPPFHPLVVHFPIVLVFVAGVFYAIGLIKNNQQINQWGFFIHVAALAGCIASILTGDYEESKIAQSPEIHALVERHETLAMISTWAIGILGLWAYLRQQSREAWERLLFLVVFWGVIGLLSFSSHIGGAMVYGHGAGVYPMQKIIQTDTTTATPSE